MSETVQLAIIAGFFGVLTTLIAAVAAYFAAGARAQSKVTHTQINSRMDELLTQARSLARAEGVAAGEQSQRDRAAASDQT